MLSRKEKIKALWDVWHMRKADQEKIASVQKRRLDDMILYARTNSPFYKKLYANLPDKIDKLDSLPYITKQQVMANFDDVVTDRDVKKVDVDSFSAELKNVGKPYLDKYIICNTSGTSGYPGVFLYDSLTQLMGSNMPRFRSLLPDWLGFWGVLKNILRGRRFALMELDTGPYSGFASIEMMKRTNPKFSKKTKLVSVLKPLAEQVDELNNLQPVSIGGYPSSILLLAGEKEAGRLKINLNIIVLAGEAVSPAEHKYLEKVFNCMVCEEYGSTENMIVAVACKEGWLHNFADWFILEPVDENYNPVAPGVRSYSVLITNLMNKVMPLIRYDQGDSIMFKPEPCSCGNKFPALRVWGRINDMLKLPTVNGEGIVSITPLNIVTVIEETVGVYRIQVVQTGVNRLLIHLQTMPNTNFDDVSKNMKQRVQEYFISQGIGEIIIDVTDKPPIQNPKSGKYSQVIVENNYKLSNYSNK